MRLLLRLGLIVAASLLLSIATLMLHACFDRDDSFEWIAKPHAASSSGWCVAYVQDNHKPAPASWSAVLLDLDQGRSCAIVMSFSQCGLPIEMRWLASDALEVRYPRTARLRCRADATERVVDLVGRRVHVIPSAM